MPKILIVTTSHDQLGGTGRQTGLWLEELATPYYALLDSGADITVASIKGGEVPFDARSIKADGNNPPPVQRFLSDDHAMASVRSTPSIDKVRASDYDAIFLPGGHAAMWDLPGNAALADALGQAFDEGRVVAAVCHGAAGLISAKRADGSPIVRDRRVSGFTDAEEEAEGLTEIMPFLLETRLRELGAHFEKTSNFRPFAVQDGNLITGQNPMSSAKVAELVLQAVTSASDRPPAVATPTDARPMFITMRLSAKDADAFKRHLLNVIPVTRLAPGCRYSHSYQGTSTANAFLLVQGWDSIEQQHAYVAWRTRRGDFARFRALLDKDPEVESFTLFDA
ncbi:MAG: hypothetical protein E5X80_26325 [Mesorhizobium sp.]|uniref:DJ-1/PfpI family protein n=1 Tax=Mesorhizobium sp. TaxID=1871066 RepID=UPI001219532D|nr:DJ-1/PfpI family protein [Mesorhizobium sp.]TIO50071.1 MAG: hypothetical protein E5X78_23200 [Mesorhizobium sp.]TIO61415.1 MAG: hypothetical protein E5X79_08090 [Mesorhizobium sp.]TJV59127.1 MAG: hypothetical protein E5X80_26325 [Mesorhizobium sp.]